MVDIDRKKEIIDAINKISGKYSAYEVFTDWIRCMAMAITNSLDMVRGKSWKENEAAYKNTMDKYTPDEQRTLCAMMGYLVDTLEDGPDDVLGGIYMASGMGSKAAGQFFTPFHLSELCARMGVSGIPDDDSIIEINEPSCGGGGMILAAVKVLDEMGISWQKRLKVVAQDLDWKGVYMCYVQLSLLGIKAVCVQGNTLTEPYDIRRTERSRMLFTPAWMGVLV